MALPLSIGPDDVDGIAKCEDLGQTAPSELGLHCLPTPVCPKTSDHYGIRFP